MSPGDAFPFEPVLRLWVLVATGMVLLALGGILAWSHALEHLARRRDRRLHGGADASPSQATAPAFDPVSLPSRYRIGSRLARVHSEAPQRHARLAQHSGEKGLAGVSKVLAGPENGDR